MTGTQARSRSKGKSVSKERKQEECFHRKAKGKCTKGTFVVSAAIPANAEQVPVLPLPLWIRRRKTMGNILRKAKPPGEGTVYSGKGSRSRAKIISKEIEQTHRVIHDILPCVKMTDHQQAARLARSVRSFTRRRTDSRRKQSRAEEEGRWPSFGM